ncbi:MAG TPA: phosphodiester glycosidase family protein [Fimbriimonadaceae bacterium]|nr:phosphodiester glycosidase family protein [Fimbriimonadaceae bacterium]
MNRLFLCGIFLACGALAPGQVWEKLLAPGLTYRMELDTSTPRMIHAFRYTPQASTVTAKPELAQLKVYAADAAQGREKLSSLVTRTGAIAGINADFFPFTGDPLGLMIKDRELVSAPYPSRAAFGWSRSGTRIGRGTTLKTADLGPAGQHVIKGLNQECEINEMAVNTSVAGLARAKTPNLHVVIRMSEGSLAPGSRLKGEVLMLQADVEALPIESGTVVLTGNGKQVSALSRLRPGDKVSFSVSGTGFNWSAIQHAVGGGPFLIVDGKVVIDAEQQGFNRDFSEKRHPRTAIGRDSAGDIWMVAVDGRQKASEGATLPEMASIMKSLGCVDAINLDGGGSTTLNIFGLTLNRPSGGAEREIANAVLIYGPGRQPDGRQYSLRGAATLQAGRNQQIRVFDSEGRPVPHSEVLWHASGAAWIDQGGLLRASDPGTVTVTAWVRGNVVQGQITITPAP